MAVNYSANGSTILRQLPQTSKRWLVRTKQPGGERASDRSFYIRGPFLSSRPEPRSFAAKWRDQREAILSETPA